ncbi:hypothetical protein B0T16DRAFT_318783 [Cercophora newfieldiana]|uniref:protoporphyrinogen oxidase n=1 Tax=Cercophora newfieldiana TaxID=92897 RepID=A0AA39YTF7_9PEZI|nr:hypothetical protein B0T16DRAFT_318783 [Cercophora newfieldiana]
MSELVIGTPLADALNVAIQNKITELEWAGGSSEGSAMSEYFILLLNNGKTQAEIISEISNLLSLGPEDQTVAAFAQWLIEQANALSSQMAASNPAPSNEQGAVEMSDDAMDASFDPSLDMMDAPSGELNVPTGPKAMRAGGMRGGSREKRMVGHINRTLDRSHDSALHRVRGQSGISRGPPTGPRMGAGRQPRTTANRAASVTAGLVNMNGMPMGPGMNGMGGVNGMPPHMGGSYMPPDILAMMEQQNQMLQQMQQQLIMQQSAMANPNNRHGHGHHGKSLLDRSSRGNNFRRGGGHHQNNGHGHQAQNPDASQVDATGQQGEDVEMSQTKREPPNPDETVCKFNLRCQNKDCKFAHQSPAAPPGVTVDVKDICTFGAACKNRKCVGRHPSPATKAAHQSEMDCKFFPNCANPNCTFRHPSMPPCRNGGECKVPNCKFTHVKTACKFNPCTNRTCPFTHEEGQRGTFKDKVWVSEEAKEHVSERKFVQDNGEEELVLPGSGDMVDESMPEVIVTCSIWLSAVGSFLIFLYDHFAIQKTPHQHATSRQQPCFASRPSNWSVTTVRRRDVGCSNSLSPCTASVRTELAGPGGPARLPSNFFDEPVYPPNYKPPRTIAVLGGGLTGLTTAWYLSRWLPKAKITLYEASDRLGGWIDTETVPVTTPDGKEGTVAFERGARMVQIYRKGVPKFDDMVFYEMIDALGLHDEVLRVSRKSPMKNYIYYPDHIVELPSPKMGLLEIIRKLATEPLFKGLLPAVWNSWKDPTIGKPKLTDDHRENQQSLATYYSVATQRPDVVDNFLSAMVHGIWGGDVSKLSDARDPLNHLYDRPGLKSTEPYFVLTDEEADLPTVMTEGRNHSYDISWTMDAIKHSHLSFKDGFSTLTNALIKALEANPMVTILKNEPVSAIRMHATGSPLVVPRGSQSRSQLFEKVISTINANTLASITGVKLPSLAETHAVTIQAVNLWYPTPYLNAPYHGFGYLIPKTVRHDLNPECALGVLFDSDREAIAGYSPDTVPGTKLTVLLGGHYWDELPPELIPDSAQAIEMAKAVVARHLGIPQHENDRAVASTKLCRECIPQHYVGHWRRMEIAGTELQKAFNGKLAVAGSSYQMPGVLGSIRAARDISYYTAQFYPPKHYVGCSPVGQTGLDRFIASKNNWMLYRKADLPMRFPSHHLNQNDYPEVSVSELITAEVLPEIKKKIP